MTGSRSNKYESLHVLTSSLCFDPTGDRVAFVAKSNGHDALFVRNIKTGEERALRDQVPGAHRRRRGIRSATRSCCRPPSTARPTFSSWISRTARPGASPNDAADQLTPRFFPDGKQIVFVYYPEVTIPVPADFERREPERLSEIDFLRPTTCRTTTSYDIWEFDIATGRTAAAGGVAGRRHRAHRHARTARRIIYASDESGVNNLHAGNIETRQTYRFTDVLGGLFTPSVHEEKGRIAFSAFVQRRLGHLRVRRLARP